MKLQTIMTNTIKLGNKMEYFNEYEPTGEIEQDGTWQVWGQN